MVMDLIKRSKVESVQLLPSVYPAPSTSTTPAIREREGTLLITPHQLLFTFADAHEELWIPLSLLSSVTLFPPSVTSLAPVTLRTFAFETYTLLFPDTLLAQDIFDSLKALVTSASLPSAYAFVAKDRNSQGKRGWSIYDPKKELERMGVGGEKQRSEAWRWSDVNKDYEFCSTYPAQLAVPSKISDVTLRYGKAYRSKHRIPALVYLHGSNLGSITRASQPMVGIKNARSIQDEKLIEAIFHSHAQHSTPKAQQAVYGARATNLIIDARPTTNAMANVAKGAGTENMEYYKACQKAYLGVDNIHVMRDSLKSITEALNEAEHTGFIDRSALRKSGWLKHIAALLDGAILIAKNVHLANSHVLVHCSDGWDRTSQLSSLAQLCLDPYYRTIEGFAVLVEKDWVSFGHKFADRAGHFVRDRTQFVVSAGDDQTAQQALLATVQKAFHGGSHAYKETSPVFSQFLDCCYQMIRQYPSRFEFDDRLLLKLHQHLYSCQFGSFLYNSEQERNESSPRAAELTDSVWDLFLDENKSQWLNEQYDASLDDSNRQNADLGVILPDPKLVAYWPLLFRRTEDDLNGNFQNADMDDAPPPPEIVGPIEGAAEDPIISIVDGIGGRSKSPIPRSGSMQLPASPRSTPASSLTGSPSESNLSRFSNNAAPQLQSAYASVMRFGGSTFKSLRKGVEEAVRDFNAATTIEADEQRKPPAAMPPLSTNPWASETSVRSREPTSEGMRSRQTSAGLPPSKREDSSVLEGKVNPWQVEGKPTTKGSTEQELVDKVDNVKLTTRKQASDPLGAL